MIATRWLEALWHDLRHAARVFVKSPGFTAIAVLSIAFGTGANVAMFSLADALLLRPPPIPQPDELLVVGTRTPSGIQVLSLGSYPDYVDIRDGARSFDGVMAYTLRRTGIAVRPGAAPQVKLVNLVSGNYFDVLRLQPAVGRTFLPEEDRIPGRDPVAVLSYGLWQRHYAGDAAAIGGTIRVNGVDLTIVGVAPDGFNGLETRGIAESVYVPLAMAPVIADAGMRDLLTARDRRILTLRGRLRPGVSIAEARAELASLSRSFERAYPDTNRNQAFIAETELESRLSADAYDAGLVLILSILSTAVLLVACANVAGLLASRVPLRRREISLRLAVGAARGRLIRQLITESLLLAVGGGVCGLGVGYAGVSLLRQMEYPTDIVQPPAFDLDERAMVFSLALAMASAFVFGLGPAVQTTRVDLAAVIKAGEAAAGRWRLRGRTSLIAMQVALCLVLVSVAVYALQMFQRVFSGGPGFRTTQIAKITVDTGHRGYDLDRAVAFFEHAVTDTRGMPGVVSASATSAMPFWGAELVTLTPEGEADPADPPLPRIVSASVDEQYFETMDIAIVAGRSFRSSDTASAPAVAIVNQTLARRRWPDGDAVGKRFRLGGHDGTLIEIVGVARDSKYIYIVEPPQEAIYFPFRQQRRAHMVILARTTGESLGIVGSLRDVIQRIDREMPAFDAQTMETYFGARATLFARMAMEMVGGIGLMGTTLTMIGLYALVAYSVNRRTREIGIRMAVGASYRHVLQMILREGLRPAWLGMVAGIPLAIITTRLLPVIFPTETRSDARLFALVALALLVVSALAAFVPARRAARVDPTQALRQE